MAVTVASGGAPWDGWLGLSEGAALGFTLCTLGADRAGALPAEP